LFLRAGARVVVVRLPFPGATAENVERTN